MIESLFLVENLPRIYEPKVNFYSDVLLTNKIFSKMLTIRNMVIRLFVGEKKKKHGNKINVVRNIKKFIHGFDRKSK